MYSLLSVQFIFFFAYSFIAIILLVLIPGNVFVKQTRIKFSLLSEFVISAAVGSALLVSLGFLLGFANLRFLTYFYGAFAVIFWIYKKYWKGFRISLTKPYLYALTIITVGSFLQLVSTFLFNVMKTDGLSYCCTMVSDYLYFAALSQELVERVPPYEPGLYGVVVHNYHYLSNLFIAEISRIFFIPININIDFLQICQWLLLTVTV